ASAIATSRVLPEVLSAWSAAPDPRPPQPTRATFTVSPGEAPSAKRSIARFATAAAPATLPDCCRKRLRERGGEASDGIMANQSVPPLVLRAAVRPIQEGRLAEANQLAACVSMISSAHPGSSASAVAGSRFSPQADRTGGLSPCSVIARGARPPQSPSVKPSVSALRAVPAAAAMMIAGMVSATPLNAAQLGIERDGEAVRLTLSGENGQTYTLEAVEAFLN